MNDDDIMNQLKSNEIMQLQASHHLITLKNPWVPSQPKLYTPRQILADLTPGSAIYTRAVDVMRSAADPLERNYYHCQEVLSFIYFSRAKDVN